MIDGIKVTKTGYSKVLEYDEDTGVVWICEDNQERKKLRVAGMQEIMFFMIQHLK